VDWFIPGPKDIISLAGQRQGREQIAQFLAKLAQMQDPEQFELREFVAQGGGRTGTLPVADKVHRALMREQLGTRVHASRGQNLEV
jgi:proteasome assembly chaperone (PAC2) family protein